MESARAGQARMERIGRGLLPAVDIRQDDDDDDDDDDDLGKWLQEIA